MNCVHYSALCTLQTTLYRDVIIIPWLWSKCWNCARSPIITLRCSSEKLYSPLSLFNLRACKMLMPYYQRDS